MALGRYCGIGGFFHCLLFFMDKPSDKGLQLNLGLWFFKPSNSLRVFYDGLDGGLVLVGRMLGLLWRSVCVRVGI